jgi:hypothetical protein
MVSELTSYVALLNSLGRVVDRHHAWRCTNRRGVQPNQVRRRVGEQALTADSVYGRVSVKFTRPCIIHQSNGLRIRLPKKHAMYLYSSFPRFLSPLRTRLHPLAGARGTQLSQFAYGVQIRSLLETGTDGRSRCILLAMLNTDKERESAGVDLMSQS